MRWILSHATDELHQWFLQKEEQSRSLILNLHRLSLRLIGISKRLFFLQVQGFLQKKILLRSEYGVVIGETAFADNPATGQLIFNGQKLYHCVKDGELLLLDSEKNLLGKSEMENSTLLNKYEFYSLLFGFAWFVTADIVAEKEQVLPFTA